MSSNILFLPETQGCLDLGGNRQDYVYRGQLWLHKGFLHVQNSGGKLASCSSGGSPASSFIYGLSVWNLNFLRYFSDVLVYSHSPVT